jgi:ribonuclease P protein component
VHRLRRKNDILRALRTGRRAYASWVTLYALRRQPGDRPAEGARLGVILARRFPSAVARNRAKRIVRAAASALLRGCREPWDVLLLARPQALGVPFAERLATIRDLLRQAGVWEREVAGAL